MGRASHPFSSRRYNQTYLVAIFFALAMTTTVDSYGQEAGEELVDKIVAIVHTTPILYSKVQDKVKKGPLVVISDYPSTEESPPFDRATNDAINYELVMDKITELEIEIKDAEIEDQIDKLLKEQNLDRNGLTDFLAQQGKNYAEYKDDFRNQMLLMRFKGRVVAPLVKVTDRDIETYFLKKSGGQSDAVVLDLRQILIQVDKDATPEVIKAKEAMAKEVHQKISGGTEFSEAVKLYSDGPDARTQGGQMKAVKLRDLSKELRTEIEKLTAGEYTTPIRTSLGFHIFILDEKKFSPSAEFLSQKQKLEYDLRNQELMEQTRRWLQEARQKTKIQLIGIRK
jgi:peptidyl-prolyl cis-trans isomerase SurA